MTQRHSVTRWFGALGVILALVGLVSQGTACAQTLAETRQAADQGDAEAQYSLGLMYATGEGVPEDFTQAAAWWRKAADQGHADAQFGLGGMYATGQGVTQDFTQAAAWWRRTDMERPVSSVAVPSS